MGWKIKKKDLSPSNVYKHHKYTNPGADKLHEKLGVDEEIDQVVAWGDRPLGYEVFNADDPYAVSNRDLALDFDPDVYLGGVSGTPQGYGSAQGVPQGNQDMGWLGYEETPIGQLYGTEYEQSPGYQFQLQEAQKAAEQNLAARGLTGSGAEQKELMRLAQGMAAQDYGRWQGQTAAGFSDYLSGLQSMANTGYGAAGGMANQAGTYGANMANLAGQQAMYGAQGTVGQANIMGSGLSQLAQLGGQAWQNYQNKQAPPQTVTSSGSNAGFSMQNPQQTDVLGFRS